MNLDDLTMSNNKPFFVPGGTLPGDAPSYVTRRADQDLLEGLRGGQFCYVLTSRQMGKSSLMIRIAAQLREQGVAVAILDLTALGQNVTVEQWYFGLLEQLGRHLKREEELDAYWQSHRGLGPLQRWMAAIRDVVLSHRSNQVTIFVDEIDIVRSLPFSTDEFFAAIRECYNRRAQEPQYERLAFCLLGVATPSGLIRDTTMTPFNIGRRIELTDFALKEAEPLSVGISVTGRDGHALLNRILYWTGGQPYLTQRLCNSVAEDTAALREEDVDRLCADLFLAQKARESNDNLQFVRNRLLRSEVDLTALLDMYSRVRQNARVADDEANALTSVLKLSGIVRVERGELKVRNRIYERVFDRSWAQAHLPGAELRRRKAAYQQGLVRAMALSSAVLMALGGLTLYGFSQARRAKAYATIANTTAWEAQRQRDAAERISYMAQMNLVQRDFEIDDFSDANDLLAGTERSRFRGFEWGYWNNRLHRERLSLKGHLSYVTSVAFSPDGKRIATTESVDNLASVWDTATGRQTLTLKGHTDAITSLAFSPDGKQIVTGSNDRTARIWDAATGQERLTFKGHLDAVTSVAFSPDGKEIVTGSQDSSARVWEVAQQETLTLTGHNGGVSAAAFSPDGQKIVTAGMDGNARVWDTATGKGKLTLKGHTAAIVAVAFSPDGRQIVTGSQDNTAILWDALTGRLLRSLKGHAGFVTSVAFSPDGRQIATGSQDYTARLWDNRTGEPIHLFQTPDTGPMILSCNGNGLGMYPVAFSPDGKRLLTAGTGSFDLLLWDTTTGKQILTLVKPEDTFTRNTTQISSGAFSPDGSQIVTSNGDKTARIWDAGTGQMTRTLKGHTGYVSSVAFSPNGKRIVTGSWDTSAKIWDSETGQETLTLKGHTGYVLSAVFSPDGKRILTASEDTTARVWTSPNGKRTLMGREDTTGAMWTTESPDVP